MLDLYRRFTDFLLIDSTFSTNQHKCFLYQLLIVDGCRKSLPVVIGFLWRETEADVRTFLLTFLEFVGGGSLVKCIMSDVGQLQNATSSKLWHSDTNMVKAMHRCLEMELLNGKIGLWEAIRVSRMSATYLIWNRQKTVSDASRRDLRIVGHPELDRLSVVRLRPLPAEFPCLCLGNLAVSRPSCSLRVAWQLGTERALQLNDSDADVNSWKKILLKGNAFMLRESVLPIVTERFSKDNRVIPSAKVLITEIGKTVPWDGQLRPLHQAVRTNFGNVSEHVRTSKANYSSENTVLFMLQNMHFPPAKFSIWRPIQRTRSCPMKPPESPILTFSTRQQAHFSFQPFIVDGCRKNPAIAIGFLQRETETDLDKCLRETRVLSEPKSHEVQLHTNLVLVGDSVGTQVGEHSPSFRQPRVLLETKFHEISEYTLIRKQIWFCERLTWNPAESLVYDVYRQLNVSDHSPSFRQPRILLETKLHEISEYTLICKLIWFFERLTWNPAESLVYDVLRQLNVLHQAASCFSRYDIRYIAIHICFVMHYS
ncbi:hypothetical protein T265_08057 [Opisthorchis viverrini]|uniref:ZSWIM1/3 RNaseH-like domain-containing protein n=1 Tax=Opisthorchis viverrini TaxID=6198 RepID=A0A074ZLI9_OPIVI|nr:hypothetical protein T265_08057 [Opisthorchis viverrini]KER24210.1 hypothetical protein T265_08057 [Opisthorchis viverrini]